MAHPMPGLVVNLADDDPASRDEVLQCAAQLRGVTLPASAGSQLARDTVNEEADKRVSSTASARSRGEKRVSNRKAKDELRWQLQFPTYREGLLDCLQRGPSLTADVGRS